MLGKLHKALHSNDEADGGLGYTLRRLIRVSRHGRKEKSHIHHIARD